MERVVADILRNRAEDCPDEPLVKCGGEWLPVADADSTSDRLACIIWTPPTPPSPAELFEFFKDTLPYFAIPRFVELRAALPITEATGRVKKHVLRQEGITPNIWDLEELGFTVARSDRR